MYQLFTSESVTKGHADKVCDQISDAILDAILSQDKDSRVAVETAVTTNTVVVFGEITTKASINVEEIVRKTIKSIGYDKKEYLFSYDTVEIINRLHEQSPDIAMGVDKEDQGAGDQGLMFGFAKNDNEQLMPLPIALSHELALRLTKVREENIVKGLRPDGKTQVTIAYDENNKPLFIDSVVLSTQHDEDITQEQLHKEIKKNVFDVVLPKELITSDTKYFINPTGRFVIGGPNGDSGLTGRKIIVDTYGGYSRHGGGAFSGKDPSKVDRSAAYMARYLAKNIVASKIAETCEIQLAYAIGVAKPVGVYVDTFNTGKVSDEKILEVILENFDLRPKKIIDYLELKNPIYQKTASYGHFGRTDVLLPWEKTDKVSIFKNLAK
ncbi:methionine adenosyltransferase [Acholeplasma palmae]|nr:methionine adenosyltransferase [Alteracholeplasma palmae]